MSLRKWCPLFDDSFFLLGDQLDNVSPKCFALKSCGIFVPIFLSRQAVVMATKFGKFITAA